MLSRRNFIKAAFLTLGFSSFALIDKEDAMADVATNSKILIAYYSRPGNNYVSGKIVNLPVGNTEVIAKKIQQLVGGNLFRIDTVKPYPEDYYETTDVAQIELQANSRPEIKGQVEDMEQYKIIFLGYPIWWGTMPMPVYTFLEKYNFSGKTIIPFCTHEGSGIARSYKEIKKLCPDSKILQYIAIKGSEVNSAKTEREIKSWLEKLKI